MKASIMSLWTTVFNLLISSAWDNCTNVTVDCDSVWLIVGKFFKASWIIAVVKLAADVVLDCNSVQLIVDRFFRASWIVVIVNLAADVVINDELLNVSDSLSFDLSVNNMSLKEGSDVCLTRLMNAFTKSCSSEAL